IDSNFDEYDGTGWDGGATVLYGDTPASDSDWSCRPNAPPIAAKVLETSKTPGPVNRERAKEMAMSDYYMINKQVLVVKKDNAADYADPEKIKSVKIAVESGSAGEDAALAVTDEKNVVSAELQLDALLEVLASTADAAIIDGVMAAYLTNKADSDFNKLVIVEGALDVEDEYYSIAFRKGSDLAVSVNDIIKGMKADGTVKKIADKYGLADVLVG
ncbi:MAG: transporter substrate-binding domain-containing protein, partial [Clostridia bacterium]|nr:transporter substrate-binding domain-containing protein [Clostridia bacterium]